MEKVKNNIRRALIYISLRKSLKYIIIIVIIILLSIGGVSINRYFNDEEKVVEQISEQDDTNGNIAEGVIKTDVDKNVSSYTLSDGFSELPETGPSNSSSNNNNSSNTVNSFNQPSTTVDKSSLSGINLEILEGDEFNPRDDLNLQATDKNGSNISDNILIEKNNVNTTIPGVYTVRASVRLSDGQTKEKEFTVTVKAIPLEVSLDSFKPVNETAKKGEQIVFDLELTVSKNHVTPTAVMVNGKEYPVYKGNENIFDKISNKKNYKVIINADEVTGVKQYNLEHIKMSNGSWLSLGENICTVDILKEEASIKNFNYKQYSESKMFEVKFTLEDTENTASNLRLELYKDNILLKSKNLNKSENYTEYLPSNSNGGYELKILADINLNENATESNTIFNKEIFKTIINISNIDETSLVGDSIEIEQGENFDINDLNLKATDVDGEDITDKIVVENSNIDTNVVGEYIVSAYVVNKNGEKHVLEVDVNVVERPTTYEPEEGISLARMLFGNYEDNKTRMISINSSGSTTVSGNDTETLDYNVKVNGIVSKDDGSLPNGKILVELPTAMAFTVDEKGNFTAGSYTISNKSSVGISISVQEFKENYKNGGITVKPISEDISSLDRSNVHLALVGNDGKYADLGNLTGTAIEVMNLKSSTSGLLQLRGESGKGSGTDVDKKGASEEFTLVFKIKKIN